MEMKPNESNCARNICDKRLVRAPEQTNLKFAAQNSEFVWYRLSTILSDNSLSLIKCFILTQMAFELDTLFIHILGH